MTLSSRLRLTTALPQSAQQPSWDTCSALLIAAELHISSVNCVQPDTPWYLCSRASFLFRLKSEGSGTAVCTPWPHLCRETHREPDGPCGPRHVENANFSTAPTANVGFLPGAGCSASSRGGSATAHSGRAALKCTVRCCCMLRLLLLCWRHRDARMRDYVTQPS